MAPDTEAAAGADAPPTSRAMLSRRLDRVAAFTRRDAVRLAVAAVLLITGLTAVLSIDDLPRAVDLSLGDLATADVRAPRTLVFESNTETIAARQAARDAVPPQYDYKAETAAALTRRQLDALAAELAPVDAAFAVAATPEQRKTALAFVLPGLSTAARSTLEALAPERWAVAAAEATRVLGLVQRDPLRDAELESARRNLGERFSAALTDAERGLATEIVAALLVPNATYSDALTVDARDAAAAAVQPVSYTIRQGEVIVEAGKQVTALEIAKLEAYGLTEARLDIARLAGWFLLAALVVVLLLAWTWRYRQELWHRARALALLGLVLLLTALAYKLTAGRSIMPFFVPGAGASMLVAILLGAGPATMITAVLAILAGAANGLSLEIAAYVFIGGMTGVIAVRRGDRVGTFLQAGFAIVAASVAVVTIFSLLGARDLTGVLQLWGASLATGVGSAIATVGTFQAVGSLFGILTVFQLLELANPSQPLLHRLLLETPGTYHHSLMVGNLAERAAEAVGADPLMARVAAYYHDVGKLANPGVFIENQAGAGNVHDDLEPDVSAQVLKAHVANGIDIAYRAKLPKPLIAFIPQHHGTTRIAYFWAKAREQAAAPLGGLEAPAGRAAADALDERRFRHNGPRPQTREAAILMLADGVEASVRSLSSQDEPAIRAMVGRIIEERLDDGQFDECDLTLRDLERIREAFIAQLLGIYHRRIAYPGNKGLELEARRTASGPGS
jgi:putative nucleotidyltransferase with HDIG domain